MAERVAIIGAGIAGLTAARRLTAAHLETIVVDKSRAPGGRCATRRVDPARNDRSSADATDLQFDHGAQYFTARDDRFRMQVDDWLNRHVVAPWTGKLVRRSPSGPAAVEPDTLRYVGLPGMSAIGADLATGLFVRPATRVTSLDKSADGWLLAIDGDATIGPFDSVLVNAPPPQAAALLDGRSALATRVGGVAMAPCWAALVSFSERQPVAFDGAFVDDGPLSWIARDSSKPQRPAGERWVLHASPAWSSAHLEADADEVADALLAAWRQVTGMATHRPRYLRAHRWRYALPPVPLDAGCLWDGAARLGVCGDWCCGARIEGAYLSGLAMAEQLLTSGPAT